MYLNNKFVKLSDVSKKIFRGMQPAVVKHAKGNMSVTIKTLGSSSVAGGFIDESACGKMTLKLDSAKTGRISRYVLQKNDVLIQRVGCGHVESAIYMGDTSSDAYALENVYIIRTDIEKIHPYYLQAYLQSKEGKEALDSRLAQNRKITHLTIDKVKNMEVPYADMYRQYETAAKFEALYAEVGFLKERIKHALNEADSVWEKYGK